MAGHSLPKAGVAVILSYREHANSDSLYSSVLALTGTRSQLERVRCLLSRDCQLSKAVEKGITFLDLKKVMAKGMALEPPDITLSHRDIDSFPERTSYLGM